MSKYTDMTDEEYDALDEELTRNPPRIISDGSDWLSQRELAADASSAIRISGLKNMTVQYLLTKAKAANKSPIQIIDELVSKEIATTV
jgi:hypothetical protein